ncbi:MAG: hypothetical protein ACFFD2_16200 [Promethearchaeota archaeon]
MALFKIWKKFPYRTALLQQYFMCHKVWKAAMPYESVEIIPEEKFRWNWKIKDKINLGLFKWDFEHIFTSVQEEHEDYLFIKFENSNQVKDFSGKIIFQEKNIGKVENTVSIKFDKLNLKDPLMNAAKFAFISLMKRDYKIFLNNVYKIVQEKQEGLKILKDCYWTDYNVIHFKENLL